MLWNGLRTRCERESTAGWWSEAGGRHSYITMTTTRGKCPCHRFWLSLECLRQSLPPVSLWLKDFFFKHDVNYIPSTTYHFRKCSPVTFELLAKLLIAHLSNGSAGQILCLSCYLYPFITHWCSFFHNTDIYPTLYYIDSSTVIFFMCVCVCTFDSVKLILIVWCHLGARNFKFCP